MPERLVPGTDVPYHLVLFGEDGAEVPEDSGLWSERVLAAAADGITDIFVLSHGWKGDVPAAITQYDTWLGAMVGQTADRERMRELVPDFKALVVGVHWPSLPWGDEAPSSALLGPEDDADDSFAAEAGLDAGELVGRYAPRIADTAPARTALTTIVTAAEDPAIAGQLRAGKLPPEVEDAYRVLFAEAELEQEGALAAPGADQPDFDPALVLSQWAGDGVGAPEDGALLGWWDDTADAVRKARNILLGPVRQLSFWTMKKRARLVGERGVHDLLAHLQLRAPGARMHLMGHSFGCIVVSAAIAGPRGDAGFSAPLPRPVDAVFLVQGAMSLWSYADEVPFVPGSTGFYRALLSDGRVRGPLVTTRSSFDSAVGKYYPLGVRVTGDVLLGDDLPKFGALGAFGIQGAEADDRVILAADAAYGLTPGSVVNVDASRVIRNGTGPSGAHSDISHPESAHLMWQAVAATL